MDTRTRHRYTTNTTTPLPDSVELGYHVTEIVTSRGDEQPRGSRGRFTRLDSATRAADRAARTSGTNIVALIVTDADTHRVWHRANVR